MLDKLDLLPDPMDADLPLDSNWTLREGADAAAAAAAEGAGLAGNATPSSGDPSVFERPPLGSLLTALDLYFIPVLIVMGLLGRFMSRVWLQSPSPPPPEQFPL